MHNVSATQAVYIGLLLVRPAVRFYRYHIFVSLLSGEMSTKLAANLHQVSEKN